MILNHMASGKLRGGFIGVDVFFVISGFLIGRHLLQDLGGGRFSFLRFYARRARRLFPALIVMLLVVWTVGWVIFPVPQFIDLGKHMVSAALFSSNFLLWTQTGYFDAPSNLKPLLHLWSLGVEEQFYILVPLLLWLDSNGRRTSIRWVLRISLVSLILTVTYPVASFFLLDTRFWELGVGVAIGYLSLRKSSSEAGEPASMRSNREPVTFALLLLAGVVLAYFAVPHPWNLSVISASCGLVLLSAFAISVIFSSVVDRKGAPWEFSLASEHFYGRAVREAGSGLGLLLIGFSMIAIGSTGWPGPQTVFPVLGTAMIISAGPATRTSKVLACRPLVFIGGISYPLYLWHWPAIVYWRMVNFDSGSVNSVIPIAAAFGLALVTNLLVEKPARFGRLGPWRMKSPPLGWIVGCLCVAGVIGVSTVLTEGYPTRVPPYLRAIATISMPSGETDWRPNRCFFEAGVTLPLAPECTPARRSGSQQILLWGDSHAAHLYPGLSGLERDRAFVLEQWTAAACPPTRVYLYGEDQACVDRRAEALRSLMRGAPDTVLLSADWTRYLAEDGSEDAVLAAVADDIHWLQQVGVKRVVLFGPGPSWIESESTELFVYMLRKRLRRIPERMGKISDVIRNLDLSMSRLAAVSHVEYISVVDQFCNPSGCLVLGSRNQTPPDLLFRDQDHLTPSGSRLLVEAAAAQILGRR